MASHADFVNDFVKVVQKSLGDEDPTSKALKRASSTAADARFAPLLSCAEG